MRTSWNFVNHLHVPLILLLSLTNTGCEAFHLIKDSGEPIDTGTETLTPNPSIDIDWKSDGIHLAISNGEGYEFSFGLAETTVECAIDTEYGCWTAEDCFSGYITPQETYSHPPYCHPLGTEGGILAYSDSLISVITGMSEDYVIQGEKTAFPAPDADENYEFSVTYYLKATSTGANPVTECWAWGADPEHFSSKNCKAPIPIQLDVVSNPVFLRKGQWELPLKSVWK